MKVICSLLVVFIVLSYVSSKLIAEHGRTVVIPEHNIVKINEKVKNINCGGCGYFALKLYQRLDTLKYELVVINDLDHVVIREIETDMFIDCKGFHSRLDMLIRYGGKSTFTVINEADLKSFIDNCGMWNQAFDRKDTLIINEFIKTL